MYFESKSGLIGCGLAALLALSPARATEILFDNGEAIDNAGLPGGNGYSSNLQSNQQVFDNFAFARDSSIESVRFQMAGGTEAFRFSVYNDDAGISAPPRNTRTASIRPISVTISASICRPR